jgi:methylenetetrahydrofolate reductase (NADPH)
MAIQSYKSFVKMTSYCQIKVPKFILDALEPIKDNDEAVKAYGVDLGVKMCQKLIEAGNQYIHFYTLNLERSVQKILESMGQTSVAKRTLPWKPSVEPKRKAEAVRPIYWANRPKSYLARTESWDDFPNGRWGDNRSPAFGELTESHFYSIAAGPLDERKAMWGECPLTLDDIYSVFVGYIEGKVPKLPWCEQSLDLETGAIKNMLLDLNKNGFLTINSQVRVVSLRKSVDVPL